MASEWFLRSGATVTGPLTTDQLKAMGKAGRVVEVMEVAKAASGPWHRASAVSGLVVVPQIPLPPGPKGTTVVVEHPAVTNVTIEKTGKKIKIQQVISYWVVLLSALMIAFGFYALESSPQAGAFSTLVGVLMLIVGVGWRIAIRILKWWHHD